MKNKVNPKTFVKNAQYSLTLEQEFRETVQLDRQETIIYKSRIRFYTFMLSNLGYIVLTNKRIVLMRHHFIKPDRVISIELNSIENIQNERKKFNILNFPYTNIEVIHLKSGIIDMRIQFLECRKKRGKYFIPDNEKTIRLFNKLRHIRDLRR